MYHGFDAPPANYRLILIVRGGSFADDGERVLAELWWDVDAALRKHADEHPGRLIVLERRYGLEWTPVMAVERLRNSPNYLRWTGLAATQEYQQA